MGVTTIRTARASGSGVRWTRRPSSNVPRPTPPLFLTTSAGRQAYRSLRPPHGPASVAAVRVSAVNADGGLPLSPAAPWPLSSLGARWRRGGGARDVRLPRSGDHGWPQCHAPVCSHHQQWPRDHVSRAVLDGCRAHPHCNRMRPTASRPERERGRERRRMSFL